MPSRSKSLSHPVDFRYYRHQVRKRWRLVTLVVLVSLAVGAFKVLTLAPLYQSSARLMIREQQVNSKVNPFNDPLDTAAGGSIGTHIKVLRSRSLAAQIVEQLGLENHPEFVTEADPLRDNVTKFKQIIAEYVASTLTLIEDQLLGDAAAGAEKSSMLSL